MTYMRRFILFLTFVFIAIPSFGQEAPVIDQELQAQVDQVALTYRQKYYRDELLQGYINDLGQSLVPSETPPGILFSFRVIDDPIPNAVAFPDGRIFVHSGLLTFVENEAQLAMILGHEIGHVIEQHTIEAIKESRSFKRGLISGLAGGVAGAITKNRDIAQTTMAAAATVQLSAYGRKQEDEADLVGCRLAMNRGFDPMSAVGFFQKLKSRLGEQGRLSNLLFGTHSLNTTRAENVQKLLGGELAAQYNKLRTEGKLAVAGGQFRFHAAGMVRDTAIQFAEVYDRYDLAKESLESIIDVRPRDPKTLWYFGRVYRLVARTDEDKSKALDLLQRAAEADERGMYPEINRDLALMLATRTGNSAAAAESLRKYLAGYVTRHRAYPPDLLQIYDYLLLFGDGKWVAPEPPRQLIALDNSGTEQNKRLPELAEPQPAPVPVSQVEPAKPAQVKPVSVTPARGRRRQ